MTFSLACGMEGLVARAATIVATVGDRDGFNGVYDPNTQPLPYRFEYLEYVPDNSPSEAPLMDRVYFGENQNPTWTATFALPAGFVITAAQFEIVTFDNDSQATGSPPSTNGTILLDGVELDSVKRRRRYRRPVPA
jgi:hypothetical protein